MTGLWIHPREVNYDDFCPMMVSLHLRQDKSTSPSTYIQESMNLVFANQDDKDFIYPLRTNEKAGAQKHDHELNTMTDKYGHMT